jgi:hypothetical protein
LTTSAGNTLKSFSNTLVVRADKIEKLGVGALGGGGIGALFYYFNYIK